MADGLFFLSLFRKKYIICTCSFMGNESKDTIFISLYEVSIVTVLENLGLTLVI